MHSYRLSFDTQPLGGPLLEIVDDGPGQRSGHGCDGMGALLRFRLHA
jgi:hypothetical protein